MSRMTMPSALRPTRRSRSSRRNSHPSRVWRLTSSRRTTTKPGTATAFSRPRTPRKGHAPSPRSDRRGGGPAESSGAGATADVANHERQHPAHDGQHDGGPDRRPPEMVELQPPVSGVFGDPRGDPQHQGVDHDMDQAEGQDVERDRQDLDDRLDERVDQTEDHAYDEDDPDPFQLGVAAYEAHPVDEERDQPQRKPGQCGAKQKRAHVNRSCHRAGRKSAGFSSGSIHVVDGQGVYGSPTRIVGVTGHRWRVPAVAAVLYWS